MMYVGNKEKNIYHIHVCEWAFKINETNLIILNYKEIEGKIACPECNPKENDWLNAFWQEHDFFEEIMEIFEKIKNKKRKEKKPVKIEIIKTINEIKQLQEEYSTLAKKHGDIVDKSKKDFSEETNYRKQHEKLSVAYKVLSATFKERFDALMSIKSIEDIYKDSLVIEEKQEITNKEYWTEKKYDFSSAENIIKQIKNNYKTSPIKIPYVVYGDSEKTGRLYEEHIGHLLQKQGFVVVYVGKEQGKKDEGIDLICYNESDMFLIQCKYRTTKDIWFFDEGDMLYYAKMEDRCEKIVSKYELTEKYHEFRNHQKVVPIILSNHDFHKNINKHALKEHILIGRVDIDWLTPNPSPR